MTVKTLSTNVQYKCDTVGCTAQIDVDINKGSLLETGWDVISNPDIIQGRLYYCPQHKSLRYVHPETTPMSLPPDLINHPLHYTSHPSGVECIQITEHMDFLLGNVVKYVWRNGLKDQVPSLVDLKKAQWYLNRKIENLERVNNENPT